MAEFFQVLIGGITSAGLYALLALGIALIFKASNIFNFAQGGFVVIGAFVSFSLLTELALPFPLSVVLLMVVGMALGFVVFRFIIRPLIGQAAVAAIIATLALLPFLEGLAIAAWGAAPRNLSGGSVPAVFAEEFSLGGVVVSWTTVFILGFAIVIIAAFVYLFFRTKLGLGMRASCEEHQLARSVGINVNMTFALVWVIAGLVGAVTGMLGGMTMVVDTGLAEFGMKALAAVLVGGLESIAGAIVGALIIGISEALVVRYASEYMGPGAGELTPFIILLVILIIKPHGLFGLKRIERV